MQLSLSKIKEPIDQELTEFQKKFRQSMKSSVPLLDRITYYIVKTKGKQMRPMFVFFSAKMAGGITADTHTGAALIELLHTASLVHDDVVDDSMKRRGFFSINALWKNKIAVLVGDYLLAKGLLLSIDGNVNLLKIMSNAVRDMSEGELLQIEKARLLDIDESVYFDIIRQKTASLISAACAVGVASATDNEATVEKAKQLGEQLGIAFQMQDDLFDLGNDNIGKPKGIDIKEKKLTLPIIYALKNTDKKKRRQIKNIIKRHHNNKQKVAEVIDFIHSSGGIDYTKKIMNEYQERANEILFSFPDNEGKKGLQQLIEYTTQRKK